jgi:hypothetical protein
MAAMVKPFFAQMQQLDSDAAEKMRAVADEIGTFSVQRFEELGFSSKARIVVYGIGAYPVFRAEILDGDKLLAFVGRVVGRWGTQLPAPTIDGNYKVWRVDDSKMGFLIALGKTEIVATFGPADVLDKNRALILGTTKPAKSLTTAHFKAIAQRDGFNAQGVGFVEFDRVLALAVAAADAPPPPACSEALKALVQRSPRMTIGYDDFSAKRISFGAVVELAPDLVAEGKKMMTKLPGIDRVLAEPSMMAFAAAFDLAQVRALASRAAGAMREIGSACQLASLAEAADDFETTAKKPMPPFLEGLSGGAVVVQSMEVGQRGPEKVSGWGTLQLADTGPALAMAAQQLPNFKLEANGKPQPLPMPPGMPFSGHIAASKHAIGAALGPDSERKAADALGGTAQPAPLALMRIDYERFFDVMGKIDPSGAMLSDMYKAFGVATMQATVDDRGAVMWFEMRMR